MAGICPATVDYMAVRASHAVIYAAAVRCHVAGTTEELQQLPRFFMRNRAAGEGSGAHGRGGADENLPARTVFSPPAEFIEGRLCAASDQRSRTRRQARATSGRILERRPRSFFQ